MTKEYHLQPITPLTIEGIREWKWCGNAWSDGPAFTSVHEFALNPANSIADRAEALRISGRDGMGLTDEEMCIVGLSDQEQVDEYVDMEGE
jgi:hypothetical protein